MYLPNTKVRRPQDHYGTMFRNTIPRDATERISSCPLPFDAAPIANAERHHLDGRHIVVDRHVLVVRMHDGGRTRAEDDRGRVGIQVEEARISGALPAADLWIAPGDLLVVLADVFDEGVIPRYFRRLRVIPHEPHFRRVDLHPGILGRRARNLIHETLLHAFVVLAGDGADASLQKAVRGERAGIVARGKASDDARKRVERLRIQRGRYSRPPPVLQVRDRLHDFVAELDAADALVALLDTSGLAVNFDFEPDAADACGLHRQVAGFAGNACVSLVPADHRIQCAVTAVFYIDDHVDVQVALGLQAGGHEAFNRHDMTGNAALHVGGPAAVHATILDRSRPRVIAPSFSAADRDDVGVSVQQQ